MFTDPQTITIDGVAHSLVRITNEGQKSIYQTADGLRKLTISHLTSKKDKRIRRMVRLDVKAIVADPLTAVNDYGTFSFYSVIDEPEFGFTDDQIDDTIQGYKAWLVTANVNKVLAGES